VLDRCGGPSAPSTRANAPYKAVADPLGPPPIATTSNSVSSAIVSSPSQFRGIPQAATFRRAADGARARSAVRAYRSLAGRSCSLEIILGSEDFDADTVQQYGWINRALPDAELPEFVDRFARRIANFEQPAIAAAKAQINKRAGVPSGEDLVEAVTVFRESGTWPGTRRRVGEALAQGLQRRGDFELNQGARLGPAARA
jgi:hypothetical protein